MTYWAGRASLAALRAVQRRLGNATLWSLSGSGAIVAGLIIWACSCPAWNHSTKATSDSVWGGIFALGGIVLLYFHGEARRRDGRG